MKACYPGTFDPVTNGHMDIIIRADRMFDELDVLIMHNPRKQCAFTPQERKDMIERSAKAAGCRNVRVLIGEGLTVEYAEKIGAKAMIRGIRAISDYEFELSQATANLALNDQIETLLMIARPAYSFLSSSGVKEIAFNGGDISWMIPHVIEKDVAERMEQIRLDEKH